jgi:hypothetical protein
MSERLVTIETARVYRYGGRRYLSRSGAYYAAAREKFWLECGCEYGDAITPPVVCDDHRKGTADAEIRKLAKELSTIDAARGPRTGGDGE